MAIPNQHPMYLPAAPPAEDVAGGGVDGFDEGGEEDGDGEDGGAEEDGDGEVGGLGEDGGGNGGGKEISLLRRPAWLPDNDEATLIQNIHVPALNYSVPQLEVQAAPILAQIDIDDYDQPDSYTYFYRCMHPHLAIDFVPRVEALARPWPALYQDLLALEARDHLDRVVPVYYVPPVGQRATVGDVDLWACEGADEMDNFALDLVGGDAFATYIYDRPWFPEDRLTYDEISMERWRDVVEGLKFIEVSPHIEEAGAESGEVID